ncbi:hypothetical protein OG21DRAFT_1513508 [Imleria badia]|nr:hypothetical protein OG21DRAFT_1513508 [Imleria badia]
MQGDRHGRHKRSTNNLPRPSNPLPNHPRSPADYANHPVNEDGSNQYLEEPVGSKRENRLTMVASR